MRCYCCDAILTPQESTRKFKLSREYTEMCTKCLSTIDDQVKVTKGKIVEETEEPSEWDER